MLVVIIEGNRIQIGLIISCAIFDMNGGIYQGCKALFGKRPEDHVAESLGEFFPFPQRKGSGAHLHFASPIGRHVEQRLGISV